MGNSPRADGLRASHKRVLLLLACLLPLIPACAAGKPGASLTRPTRVLNDRIFDTLPTFPDARPVGPAQDTDGGVVRTWVVAATTETEVHGYYAEAMHGAGWAVVEPPVVDGLGGRSLWRRDGAVVELLTALSPPPGSVRYSLALRPT